MGKIIVSITKDGKRYEKELTQKDAASSAVKPEHMRDKKIVLKVKDKKRKRCPKHIRDRGRCPHRHYGGGFIGGLIVKPKNGQNGNGGTNGTGNGGTNGGTPGGNGASSKMQKQETYGSVNTQPLMNPDATDVLPPRHKPLPVTRVEADKTTSPKDIARTMQIRIQLGKIKHTLAIIQNKAQEQGVLTQEELDRVIAPLLQESNRLISVLSPEEVSSPAPQRILRSEGTKDVEKAAPAVLAGLRVLGAAAAKSPTVRRTAARYAKPALRGLARAGKKIGAGARRLAWPKGKVGRALATGEVAYEGARARKPLAAGAAGLGATLAQRVLRRKSLNTTNLSKIKVALARRVGQKLRYQAARGKPVSREGRQALAYDKTWARIGSRMKSRVKTGVRRAAVGAAAGGGAVAAGKYLYAKSNTTNTNLEKGKISTAIRAVRAIGRKVGQKVGPAVAERAGRIGGGAKAGSLTQRAAFAVSESAMRRTPGLGGKLRALGRGIRGSHAGGYRRGLAGKPYKMVSGKVDIQKGKISTAVRFARAALRHPSLTAHTVLPTRTASRLITTGKVGAGAAGGYAVGRATKKGVLSAAGKIIAPYARRAAQRFVSRFGAVAGEKTGAAVVRAGKTGVRRAVRAVTEYGKKRKLSIKPPVKKGFVGQVARRLVPFVAGYTAVRNPGGKSAYRRPKKFEKAGTITALRAAGHAAAPHLREAGKAIAAKTPAVRRAIGRGVRTITEAIPKKTPKPKLSLATRVGRTLRTAAKYGTAGAATGALAQHGANIRTKKYSTPNLEALKSVKRQEILKQRGWHAEPEQHAEAARLGHQRAGRGGAQVKAPGTRRQPQLTRTQRQLARKTRKRIKNTVAVISGIVGGIGLGIVGGRVGAALGRTKTGRGIGFAFGVKAVGDIGEYIGAVVGDVAGDLVASGLTERAIESVQKNQTNNMEFIEKVEKSSAKYIQRLASILRRMTDEQKEKFASNLNEKQARLLEIVKKALQYAKSKRQG